MQERYIVTEIRLRMEPPEHGLKPIFMEQTVYDYGHLDADGARESIVSLHETLRQQTPGVSGLLVMGPPDGDPVPMSEPWTLARCVHDMEGDVTDEWNWAIHLIEIAS